MHDERPDLRILASDNVLPAVQGYAAADFTVLSPDSIQARVPADGLQMAWFIGAVTRTGSRYYLDFAMRPVGGACLCGGGVNLTLERRGTAWVVVILGMWIS